jgi:hypothetical protein
LAIREAIMHKSGVVEYKHDGYECEGFAAWDDASAKRPGILVFPEWVEVIAFTALRRQQTSGKPKRQNA